MNVTFKQLVKNASPKCQMSEARCMQLVRAARSPTRVNPQLLPPQKTDEIAPGSYNQSYGTIGSGDSPKITFGKRYKILSPDLSPGPIYNPELRITKTTKSIKLPTAERKMCITSLVDQSESIGPGNYDLSSKSPRSYGYGFSKGPAERAAQILHMEGADKFYDVERFYSFVRARRSPDLSKNVRVVDSKSITGL